MKMKRHIKQTLTTTTNKMYRTTTTISKSFKSCKSCKHYRIFGYRLTDVPLQPNSPPDVVSRVGPKAKNLHVVNGEYCTKFTKIESIFDARTSNLLCGLDGKFHEYQSDHDLNVLKKDLKYLAVFAVYLIVVAAPHY